MINKDKLLEYNNCCMTYFDKGDFSVFSTLEDGYYHMLCDKMDKAMESYDEVCFENAMENKYTFQEKRTRNVFATVREKLRRREVLSEYEIKFINNFLNEYTKNDLMDKIQTGIMIATYMVIIVALIMYNI